MPPSYWIPVCRCIGCAWQRVALFLQNAQPMQEQTSTVQPVLTEKVLQDLKSLQDNYDMGSISEVFEELKDYYSIYSNENEDERKGIIETTNFIRDLCRNVIYAPIISAT